MAVVMTRVAGRKVWAELSAAGAPPTRVAASQTYALPAYSQTLIRVPIELGAGSSITGDAGGVLVGV